MTGLNGRLTNYLTHLTTSLLGLDAHIVVSQCLQNYLM